MAQAVLLSDVEDLGSAGEAVEVSPGYLRNYLIPRKLAQPATKGSLEEAQRRLERAKEAEEQAAAKAGENAALLSKTVLTINHQPQAQPPRSRALHRMDHQRPPRPRPTGPDARPRRESHPPHPPTRRQHVEPKV